MNFKQFFSAIHGYDPFPWQIDLADRVCNGMGWPDNIDIPTACGKTAVVDISLFHLIKEAASDGRRTAPLRTFFVIDRRIVVDATYQRALKIRDALKSSKHTILSESADILRDRFKVKDPLHVAIMRGAVHQNNGWVSSPHQPTICVSTVDQVGSRLLFRGYGVSDKAKPIHAGLIAYDSLVVVDEAHLSGPLIGTLNSVRNRCQPLAVDPVRVVSMTATHNTNRASSVTLGQDDLSNPILNARINKRKEAQLVQIKGSQEHNFVQGIVKTAENIKDTLSNTVDNPVVGVVVNRVYLARKIAESLKKYNVLLLTGRSRPFDRDSVLFRDKVQDGNGWFRLIKADRDVNPNKPTFVVSTQVVEVGADISFDGLVTEIAPLDSLRQRFGRLNRLGGLDNPIAAIVARSNIDRDDKVYGAAPAETWEWLSKQSKGSVKKVDFCHSNIQRLINNVNIAPMLAEQKSTPSLTDSHLDLLCQTDQMPAIDPSISAYLHGPDLYPADVQVIWRDFEHELTEDKLSSYVSSLNLIPPMTMEACPVPVPAVREWLQGKKIIDSIYDVDGQSMSIVSKQKGGLPVIRWLGPDKTEIVEPEKIAPGDTIVVPSTYGGCDVYGWNPLSRKSVPDISESCSRWGRGRVLIRINRSYENKPSQKEIKEYLRSQEYSGAAEMSRLDLIKLKCGFNILHNDLKDGVVACLKSKLSPQEIISESQLVNPIEDDASDMTYVGGGSTVSLDEHSYGVEWHVKQSCEVLNIPDAVKDDLSLAARLHDVGKADPRFQDMLYGGPLESLKPCNAGKLIAKSATRSDLERRIIYQQSRLPKYFRHEAVSVQALLQSSLLDDSNDSEFVKYIIGTHHGRGRSLFPVCLDDDPRSFEATVCGHDISYDHCKFLHEVGSQWPNIFWSTIRRLGYWGTAYYEALFRLADQQQSKLDAHK